MAVTTGEGAATLPLRERSQGRTTPPELAGSKLSRRRRSASFHFDSSEEYPSPHDSIYEAVYVSPTSSVDDGRKIRLISIPPRKDAASPRSSKGNNENQREASSLLEVPTPITDEAGFLYGHGTPLDTITEQKSCATMSTLAKTQSTGGSSYLPRLRHQDSFVITKKPRRQQSFSLDDLVKINKTYHDACAMIERETLKPLSIHEVYAQPKTPIHAPPQRPGTPPEMPSWTAAQERPRLADPQPTKRTRFRGWLGLSGAPRAMSYPGPLPQKFRPPKSAYGPLQQHPFTRAIPTKAGGPSQTASRRVVTVPKVVNQSEEARRSALKTNSRLEQRVRYTAPATTQRTDRLPTQAVPQASASIPVHTSTLQQAAPYENDHLGQGQCPHFMAKRAAKRGQKTSQPQLNDSLGTSDHSHMVLNSSTPQTSASSHLASPSLPVRMTSHLYPQHWLHVRLGSPVLDVQHSNSRSPAPMADLISSAIDPSRPRIREKSSRARLGVCWRCKYAKVRQKLDRLWEYISPCLCLICCGYDKDDDSTRSLIDARMPPGLSPKTARIRRRGYEMELAPRIVYAVDGCAGRT